MGNTASVKEMTVANASIYDIYVKQVPERARPRIVKAESKRSSIKRLDSSEDYLEESIAVVTEKESFTVIRPCELHSFPGLENSNFLSVEAEDENGGKRMICSEMKVDNKFNQIFAYTTMKRSRKGKIWIDKENNNYENDFDKINKYLDATNLYRKKLETQIGKLKQNLQRKQLLYKEQNDKMIQNIITKSELNPECTTCNWIKQKAASTLQCEDVKEAVKTYKNECEHVKDVFNWEQSTIYQKKLKMEGEIEEIRSKISRLENTKELDNMALSSESSFQQFKEKQRTQLKISIISKPNKP